jgi:hypothetical protein
MKTMKVRQQIVDMTDFKDIRPERLLSQLLETAEENIFPTAKGVMILASIEIMVATSDSDGLIAE